MLATAFRNLGGHDLQTLSETLAAIDDSRATVIFAYTVNGIYTAPTDDALRFDIQQQKSWGFNMIRKHIKVEPQRWFHWADKLGMLVWQDMPSMNSTSSASVRTQWLNEFHAVVNQHLSSPSVVMWVNQNEGWGQFDPAGVTNTVRG